MGNHLNYIFIHIPRCGGTSIRNVLRSNNAENPNSRLVGWHSRAIEERNFYYTRGKNELFDNAFKFTVVRHPAYWLSSLYNLISNISTKHPDHKEVENMDFRQFLEWHLNVALKGKNKSDVRYFRMKDYIVDEKGNEIVDFVIKLENYNEGLKYVGNKIGIDFSNIKYFNKTPDKLRGISDKEMEYIYSNYFEDINYFKYDMFRFEIEPTKDVKIIKARKYSVEGYTILAFDNLHDCLVTSCALDWFCSREKEDNITIMYNNIERLKAIKIPEHLEDIKEWLNTLPEIKKKLKKINEPYIRMYRKGTVGVSSLWDIKEIDKDE